MMINRIRLYLHNAKSGCVLALLALSLTANQTFAQNETATSDAATVAAQAAQEAAQAAAAAAAAAQEAAAAAQAASVMNSQPATAEAPEPAATETAPPAIEPAPAVPEEPPVEAIPTTAMEAVPELPAEEAIAVEEEAEAAAPGMSQVTGDILWLVLAAVLVFFMQAGFAMLESGMTRAKNACNIMMKNILDFSFAALAFWAIGYAFMYGEMGNTFIGWDKGLVFLDTANNGQDNLLSAGWLFQVVFCGTAATIVGGAMAERTKFIGYVIYSIFISALIYPISGHWIWAGDGWLAAMGMRDFAGSTVVHSVGAWAGLAGAIILGARAGKFDKEGRPRPIPGHNLPMASLGCFILWFGWFGFNAGSTLAATDGLAHVAVTTLLAAAAGAAAATLTTWWKFGKPDLTMSINGCLAGLVSITAPCASVSTTSAAIIGAVGGVLVVFSALFIENKLKVDDPVGAISVHGVCGAWGTLSIGLFGSSAIDVLYWDSETAIKDGLFLGGGMDQLLVQAAGVASVFAFTFAAAYILFSALSKTVGIRVKPEDELSGLDIVEHGNEAYADFQVYADEMPEAEEPANG
ncbi:ammonium transporter [Rubellicoccus peritrichatus]|uniref:Ammonium transporter n=1 Tax=Rubellicoccus peritrichatus TaxID=3080537 RepID=A0AAQ3L518_9BACT|nr:ammonium transporter [Puniceicoccus sp. CR14]WOO39524.1 ammonium transporter [Puniceicoccus sp. CR14]